VVAEGRASICPPSAHLPSTFHLQKEVEEQLSWALRGVQEWQDLGGGARLVHMEASVCAVCVCVRVCVCRVHTAGLVWSVLRCAVLCCGVLSCSVLF
jgi:hypothetical protein